MPHILLPIWVSIPTYCTSKTLRICSFCTAYNLHPKEELASLLTITSRQSITPLGSRSIWDHCRLTWHRKLSYCGLRGFLVVSYLSSPPLLISDTSLTHKLHQAVISQLRLSGHGKQQRSQGMDVLSAKPDDQVAASAIKIAKFNPLTPSTLADQMQRETAQLRELR